VCSQVGSCSHKLNCQLIILVKHQLPNVLSPQMSIWDH
jgi:hypothetical protein